MGILEEAKDDWRNTSAAWRYGYFDSRLNQNLQNL